MGCSVGRFVSLSMVRLVLICLLFNTYIDDCNIVFYSHVVFIWYYFALWGFGMLSRHYLCFVIMFLLGVWCAVGAVRFNCVIICCRYIFDL